MFPNKIIGERIILRPYEKGDIPYWQKWDSDPEVQAFMPGLCEESSLDKQLEYLEECKNEKDSIYWSIVWKENNQLETPEKFMIKESSSGFPFLFFIRWGVFQKCPKTCFGSGNTSRGD